MIKINCVLYEYGEKIPFEPMMMNDIILQYTKKRKVKILNTRYVIQNLRKRKS